MANIKLNDLKLTAESMEQVKGGPAYIKLGDIEGESTDSKHDKWINLESISYNR